MASTINASNQYPLATSRGQSGGGDGYSGEIGYMLEAVRSGKAPKVVTARDGLSAVEICEAEAKSVRTGKVVAVGGR